MRVNVYAEEMTDRVEIVRKTIDGQVFTGVRFYLYLPVSMRDPTGTLRGFVQERGPFLHHDGDDDSAAVTFWGKRQLAEVLKKALAMLEQNLGRGAL